MAANLSLDALWVSTGDPTTVNDSTTSPFALGQLGKVGFVTNRTLFDPGLSGRGYQYVKLKSDATAAVGAVVIWDDYDNFVVTTVGSGTAANYGKIAGWLPSAAITPGNYGFIGVSGNGPVQILAATTPANGDILLPSATAGRTDALAPTLTAASRPFVQLLGTVLSLKNAGSIGTDVVEANLQPQRYAW